MDTTLFLFGSGFACVGYAARWLVIHIEERITATRELQENCDHVWLPIRYDYGAWPTRQCKWCKHQQHYHQREDEWHD